MLNKLQLELAIAMEKLDLIQDWLINHTTHPDFMKLASDRNHLSIKINAIEFKINQLERGLPILGEAEIASEVSMPHNNSFKPVLQ